MVGTTTAKDELQAIGENVDDFVVQTESKLRESIMNLTKVASNGYKGFDILDENGNYKSFYERMLGLSEIYEELQEQDKKLGNNSATALIELIAGKNRSAIAGAVLSSPEVLKEAYDLAMKAEGSAQEELNKYLESAEAKVQELKNQLQEFWSVLLDSGTLKTIISNLTTILEKATELVDTFGTLGTAGLGAGLFASFKGAGRVKEQLTSISTVLNNTGNTTKLLTSFSALDVAQQKVLLSSKLLTEEQKVQCATMATLTSANAKYTAEQIAKATGVSAETLANLGLIKSTDTLTISELAEKAASDAQAKSVLEKIITQNAQAVANGEVTASNVMLATSEGGATLATGAFTTAIKANIKAMWTWMTTTPVGWITMLVGGILGAVTAYNALTDSVEETKEKAEDLISTYKTALDTANSHKDSIDNIADRYEELSKGVNNLGENVSLTAEEYQEYNSIVNDIAEMFPTMVQGYTDEGNAILKLKGNVDALREAYEAEAQAAYNSLISTGKDSDGNDILKDANNVIIGSTLGAHDWGNAEKIDYLDKLMDATDSVDSMLNLWDESLNSAYSEWFEDFAGVGGTVNIGKLTDEDLANIRKNAKILKQQYQAEIDSAVDNAETLANAYLMTNEDYAKLDEQSKNAASIMVNSLNADIVSKFGEDKENVGKYVDDIVQIISTNPDAKDAMIGLFTMDTTDMPVDDIEYWTNAYIDTIAKILQEDPTELKIRLGFDNDTTEPLKTKVQGFLKDEFDGKVGELTLEELDVASKLEIPKGTLLSWDELIAKIKEVQSSTLGNEIDVLSTTEFLTELETLSKGLDQIDEIYADVYDKEDFDWSSILNNDDFLEEFGSMTNVTDDYKDAYENFIETVSNSPDDLEACQSSFNNLATAYIYNSGVLDNLTEETKDATIAFLEQKGVANAEEIVIARLTAQKEALALREQALAITKGGVTAKTRDEIVALLDEAGASETTRNYLFKLIAEEQVFNKQGLSVSEKIKSLESLASAYGSVASAAAMSARLSYMKEQAEKSHTTFNPTLADLKDLQQEINDVVNTPITVDYKGGSATQSAIDKASKEQKEETVNTETYDHIERKLEVIAKKTEKVGEAFEKAFTLTNTEKSYAEYLSQIYEEISANNTAIQTYQAKLNSIGLSADWIAKIQNGEYSITDVTDDALNERIGLYQEYYDKLESCQETVEELEKKRLEAQNQYAEKIVEIYDKEIEKIDKLIDRRESLIELKEKFGGSASASDLKYEQKKYSQQITIYDKQIDKLKELQKTVAVGSDAWKTYKEQIEANKESVLDITNSIADLAEQLASLPLEKYEKFLEKNDAKNEYYTSKYNNVVSTASKGKLLTNQIDALTAKNDKTQSYATTAKKNFNNSKTSVDKAYNSDMNNKNTTDEEKSVLTEYRNKVKNYTKNNKKIPASLITKIGKDGFGEFHKACINYNEMLEAKDAAVETAKLTAEQTRTEIRELAEQKYNLPIEKYDEGVEKNDKKDALYEAQLSNKTSASSKNKVINKQIKLEENNLAKAQNAVKETSKNVTSSISDIKTAKTQESKGKTKTEKSKINKLYTQVSKYTKSKKAIPNDLITKIGKAGLTSLQTACDEYNAALAANQTATDTAKVVAEQTKSNVNELKKQQFDNIQEKYSRKASQIQAKANNIDSRIALLEAKGYQSSASWYNELIAYEKQNLANSQAELKALKAKQNEMTKYTDEWWEAQDAIDSVTQSINDGTLALQEYVNKQREINFENFEFLQGQISRLSEEAQYFIDLMQNKEMTGDNGLTNYGLTAMGLYYQQIETGLNQAQDYAKKIAEIDQELLKEPYDTELLTQKQEYIDAQRDIMTNNESLKKSIADLVKDGYDSLLDSLGEVIDKYKEVLQNAKDAHDYQKNISDKTENINTLQKQITAYASMTGNDEVASKLQSLQAEYKDAQEDLQETLYDKYISDTEEILDEMLDELETFIEELSKNIEELYKIGVEQITNGVGDIYTTLRTLANNANTPMSNEMTIVWEDNSLMTNLTTAIEEATKAIKATIDEQSDASAFEVFSSKYDKTDYDSQIATAKRDWDSARLRISEYGGITDEEPYLDIKNSLEKDNADMQAEIKRLESKIAKTKNEAKIAEFNQRINDLISKIASNNAEIKTNDLVLEKVRELNDGLENATIAYINAVNAKTSAMDNNKAVIKELLSAIANDYPTGLSDEQTELDKKVSDILGMTSYLSKANISQLAELFGVRDNEFFVLQALKNAGFATGGIVKAVGEDGIGLVRNGEGFVMPEVVPIMQDILGAMPKIDTFIDTTLSNLPSNRGNIEQTIEFGDIYMSGVNDPQEFSKQLISTFQNEAKVQKMFGTFVNNSLTGKNSLGIRKY